MGNYMGNYFTFQNIPAGKPKIRKNCKTCMKKIITDNPNRIYCDDCKK